LNGYLLLGFYFSIFKELFYSLTFHLLETGCKITTFFESAKKKNIFFQLFFKWPEKDCKYTKYIVTNTLLLSKYFKNVLLKSGCKDRD